MIRNPHFLRAIATFLLLEMSSQALCPLATHALTGGANQPEFTSYEAPGSTDMVNLATGDFTYNLPFIEVPGPEGGFSLPLSYHSGIGLEDEATWAGLGWNINPGAISRARVGSPDDDKDVTTDIHVQDPGGRGFVKNFMLYQRNWDSNRGYGGAVNMLDVYGFSWESGNFKDATVLGLTFNREKVSFNEQQAFNGILTVASMGAGAAASKAAQAGSTQAASFLLGQNAMDIGMTAQGLYSGYKSMGTFGGSVGSAQYERSSSHLGFRQDYRYWLDATRTEHGYGALYLGQMQNVSFSRPRVTPDPSYITHPYLQTPQGNVPTQIFPTVAFNPAGNEALVSDMYTYVEPNTPYAWSFNPTHIAYDSYSVMGPGGVSGNISPYRKDIGSLVYPKEMSNMSRRIDLVPFVNESSPTGKVQFKYDGDLSNSYSYHDSNGSGFSATYTDPPKRVVYNLTDPKMTDPASRVEADRSGLYHSRLAQGRHVEWFTNEEMKNGGPSQAGSVMEDALAHSYRNDLYGVV